MSFQTPPEVQAIHGLFKTFTRYYAPLTTAFDGNPVTTIVFSEFLYQDGLRLARNAALFSLTDHQLSERCGIGLDQAQRARDMICAPGIALFEKRRLGSPPINHYCGDYPRIYAWLELNNIGKVNLPKTGKSIEGKPANQFAGNRPPTKKESKYVRTENDTNNQTQNGIVAGGGDQSTFDFVLSEPERAVIELFGQIAGVRLNQTTLTIARKLISSGADLEKLRTIAQAEWASIGDRPINPAGVFISRMRGIDPATWQQPAQRQQKQKRNSHRLEQATYTDEERLQESQRAKERLDAKSDTERIAELQQRISNAQSKLSRPGANIEYWQQYIDQKQRELQTLLVPTEGAQ